MNRATGQNGDDVTAIRTVKLVRLRVGVFATGVAVGERRQPSRPAHVVDISADLDAPEGVTACCGVPFAAGTLVEVPWMTMDPHRLCRERSPFPIPAALNQPRTGTGARAENAVADEHNVGSVFRKSSVSVKVTAQWSVNDPVIYVKHAKESDSVDLAVSGPGHNDVIAHLQLTSPLDVLTAGHNLINAGLSLAETLGMDMDQVKAITPPSWWVQGTA